LTPGARVAYLGPSGATWAEVVLGCAWAGLVAVPVNWRLAPQEVRAVLDDAQAAVLIVDQAMWQCTGEAVAGWGGVAMVVGQDYESWRDTREPAGSPVDVDPQEAVLQLYTSGTTGRPKGVMLTHRGLAHLLVQGAPAVRVTAASRNLFTTPMFHIAGAGFALMTLWSGAHGIVPPAASPEALMGAIDDHRITTLGMVPTMIQAMLDHPERGRFDLSSLRTVIYGAAPIPPSLLERALREIGCVFLHNYGLTEATGFVTVLEPEEHVLTRPDRLRSCGRPVPWVRMRVVDPDSGLPLAPGRHGELQIRSAQVMGGYWRQPDATAAAFTPDGWLRTGDIATIDAEGYVYVLDRLDDMIISGGENVVPAEVESALIEHPSVAAAAVVGVPHPQWGETVKAILVCAPAATIDVDDVLAFTRERLAHYKCPTSVDVIDELPLNATGKVDRRALRDRYRAS
jgi:acyl-CoA synthetase (AMP-forming)/AMP-acid ligase II